MIFQRGSGFSDSNLFPPIYLLQKTRPLLSSQTVTSPLHFSFKNIYIETEVIDTVLRLK